MAIGATPITVVGNLVADPELRKTPQGVSVTNFRVASTPRTFNRQSNQFEDGEPLFLTVNAWRQLAENICQSVVKGNRVIVTGELRQRSYTTDAGENRHVYEIEAESVGADLTFATATVERTQKGATAPNVQNGGQQYGQAPQATYATGTGGFGQSNAGYTQSPTGGFGQGQQGYTNQAQNSGGFPPQGGYNQPANSGYQQ